MYKRFVHVDDKYAVMWYSAKSGKKGYFPVRTSPCQTKAPCVNCNQYGKCSQQEDEPLTFEQMRKHVLGDITLATYQIGADNTVKYLEFDIDRDTGSSVSSMQDVEDAAREIGTRLYELFGPRSCILEYSGNKGMHIWVLFEDPIPARSAYGIGHYIADAVDVDGVDIEVFPKQTATAAYGYNTRLPFGIHRQTGFRSRMLDGDLKPYDDQLAAFRAVREIPAAEVADLITRYGINVPEQYEPGDNQGQMICMSRLMQEGLPKGSRDILLYRTCCYLRDRGFDENMARMVAEEINRRSLEPMDDEAVLQKVQSAYSANYSGWPCSLREFDQFCSSTCPLFAKKAAKRGMTVEQAKGRISRD